MHRVAIVAMDSVVPTDLAIPTDVFGHVLLPDGRPGYEVQVCSVAPEVRVGARGVFHLRTQHGLDALAHAHTIVLAGIDDLGTHVPADLIAALRAAAARGARLASICSGAFVLAATGLLDGKRATTHWAGAEELARRHPAIIVDPDVLYVDQGQILTSAGATAGMDLCLHLVRLDYGCAAAAEAAKLAVVALERDGSQAQQVVHAPPAFDGSSLAPLLDWLHEHLHSELTLEQIARQAAMSERTLNRRFRQQLGTTPRQWLIRARVRRAQMLLETTTLSVEHIAAHVGFPSMTTFRQQFRRVAQANPGAYRRVFKHDPPEAAAAARP